MHPKIVKALGWDRLSGKDAETVSRELQSMAPMLVLNLGDYAWAEDIITQVRHMGHSARQKYFDDPTEANICLAFKHLLDFVTHETGLPESEILRRIREDDVQTLVFKISWGKGPFFDEATILWWLRHLQACLRAI